MAVRRLPGTALRVRRGRRSDLEAVHALVGRTDAASRRRFDRRLLADPGYEVWVAEDDAGTPVGVVALAYVRSLAAGRWLALVDAVRAAEGAGPEIVPGLLALAAGRARLRGCRELRAWDDAAGTVVG